MTDLQTKYVVKAASAFISNAFCKIVIQADGLLRFKNKI